MILEVNWSHPLNMQLSSWFMVTPGSYGVGSWADLCGRYKGTLTNLDSGECWVPATRQGHYGAFQSDGVDGYIALAGGGGFNAVQTGTISLWVKWKGTQDVGANGNNGAIMARQSASASFSNHIISLNGTNPDTAKIRWGAYISNVFPCTSLTSPGDGVWRHILIAYRSGLHQLYVDGVLESTGVTTGTIANDATVPLTIGAFILAGASFAYAEIDCVRLFPERFFSAPEAAEEFQHTSDYCNELFLTPRRSRTILLPTRNASLTLTLADNVLSAAAQVAIASSLSKTLAGDTGTSSGTVGIDCSLSSMLQNQTLSAAGAVAITAVHTSALEDHELSAAGQVSIAAELASIQEDNALTSSGLVAIAAALSATEANDSLSSAGTVAIVAELVVSEQADVLSSDAAVAIAAALGVTQEDDSLSSSGAVTVESSLSVTEDADVLSGVGTVTIVADFSQTEENDTLQSSGTVSVAGEATLVVTLENQTLQSTATVLIDASLAKVEAPDTLTSTGQVLVQSSLAVTELNDFLTSAVQVLIVGSAGITEANDTLVSTASEPEPVNGGNLFLSRLFQSRIINAAGSF